MDENETMEQELEDLEITGEQEELLEDAYMVEDEQPITEPIPTRPVTGDYQRIITTVEQLNYFGAARISERHFMNDNSFIITRVVRLPFEAPEIISLDGFTLDGLDFKFSSLRMLSDNGITQKQYEILLEIQSNTTDMSEINALLPSFQEFSTNDGYEGILYLISDSISIMPSDAEWERFYFEEVKIFEDLTFGDVSAFPISFIEYIDELEVVFSIDDVDWQMIGSNLDSGISHNFNDDIPLFNAVVTYRGNYAIRSIPNFTIQAVYRGDLFNFNNFPSILYEVSFRANIDNRNILSSVDNADVNANESSNESILLPDDIQNEDEYQNYETSTQQLEIPSIPEPNISRPIIFAVIIFAIIGIGFLIYKMGWWSILFNKILILLKVKEPQNEDNEYLEMDGEDENNI